MSKPTDFERLTQFFRDLTFRLTEELEQIE
jgi:hypothetical protein